MSGFSVSDFHFLGLLGAPGLGRREERSPGDSTKQELRDPSTSPALLMAPAAALVGGTVVQTHFVGQKAKL